MKKIIMIILTGLLGIGGGAIVNNASARQESDNQIQISVGNQEISLEEAKIIALKKIQGTVVEVKEDGDEYEIIISKDGYLYEVEINKEKGEIVEIEKEKIQNNQMTLEDAKNLALSKINGKIISTEIEDEEYQFQIEKNDHIYEIEIDREKGVIHSIEKEHDNH